MPRYKYCIVPMCKSTTIRTPEKLFFYLPAKIDIRKKWCLAMKRDRDKKKNRELTSVAHVCEDHFDLENDMENYMQFKLQGGRKFLKNGVVPHIFKCQLSVPVTPKRKNRPGRSKKHQFSRRSNGQRRQRLKENESKVSEEIESGSTPMSFQCEPTNTILRNQENIGNPNPLRAVMPCSTIYQNHSIQMDQNDDTDDLESLFLASNFQTHNIKIEQQDDTDDPEPFLIAMPTSSAFQSYNKQSNCLQQNLDHNYLNDTDYQPLDIEKAEKCTESITKFLATSMQPCSLVEEESFKKMVRTLNPRYCIPERKYFSNTAIPKLYTETMDKLKEILSKDLSEESYFSVTCDCSTSVVDCSYMVISVYYVNTNWNLISACLDCACIDGKPSSKSIKDAIMNKLVEWGLDLNFIVSCTTDNDVSIANGLKLLNINHVPCFAHSLTVGINRVIEVPQVQKAIRNLKSLQNAIANNWEMKKKLRNAQESLLLGVKKFPSACPTGWLSTLKLCIRFLENQYLISEMFQNFPETTMPTKSDITALKNFVQVASVLKAIIKDLSSENCIESSAVLPLVYYIKTHLQMQGACKNRLLNSLNETFLNALIHYEKEPLQTMLRCSTFLDPRFKLNCFNESVKEIVKENVISKVGALYKSSGSLISTIWLKRSSSEIEEYIAMPKLDTDANPLQWWHQYAKRFPKLCIIAKKYLCVQGSSVPPNRVFSTGENVINKNLCYISPKDAEMQVFLASNKKILEI